MVSSSSPPGSLIRTFWPICAFKRALAMGDSELIQSRSMSVSSAPTIRVVSFFPRSMARGHRRAETHLLMRRRGRLHDDRSGKCVFDLFNAINHGGEIPLGVFSGGEMLEAFAFGMERCVQFLAETPGSAGGQVILGPGRQRGDSPRPEWKLRGVIRFASERFAHAGRG